MTVLCLDIRRCATRSEQTGDAPSLSAITHSTGYLFRAKPMGRPTGYYQVTFVEAKLCKPAAYGAQASCLSFS